jgi:phenylalanyl-tRNA synthetase beta chain
VITDGSGPIALAGVMGGQATEVTAATSRILLESASFEARSIRRTARRLGLLSEASQRFERGVDPALADRAAARAAVLLARLGGGRIATGLVDHDRRPPARPPVPLRLARAQLLTGTALTTARARPRWRGWAAPRPPTATGAGWSRRRARAPICCARSI